MSQLTSHIPLSLYIHIPWCVKKCPYCDFNSHGIKTEIPEAAYIDKLIHDFETSLPSIWGRRFVSIFFGGGTPSLFKPESIERLLNKIRELVPFSEQLEITLEANPGTLDNTRFKEYRALGINRLSIGVQSFNDEMLNRLGRIHDSSIAIRAIEMAQDISFDSFNIDLMYALPEQSLAQAIEDLKIGLSLSPPHLSWYHLTLEPNTAFYANPPLLPSTDLAYEIQEQGFSLLKNNGYSHYEVSAFCREEHEAKHNVNYWEFGDYLGIGAGAHSKLTNMATRTIERFSKIKYPTAYLAADNLVATKDLISNSQLPFEFMMNALRLHKKISYELFEGRTGLSRNVLKMTFESLQLKGLLQSTCDEFWLTSVGRKFLNDVLLEFMG